MVKIKYNRKDENLNSFSIGWITDEFWESLQIYQNLFKDKVELPDTQAYLGFKVGYSELKTVWRLLSSKEKREFYFSNSESITQWEELKALNPKGEFDSTVVEFYVGVEADQQTYFRMSALLGQESIIAF